MKDRKLHIGYGVVYTLLILWALTTIFPLAWSVMNSFKNKKMIYSNSFALPDASSFSLENYRNIFANYDIFRAYRNSFIISGAVAAAVILMSGMAAYILTRYHFLLKKALIMLLYAGMMFPVYSTIIPVFRMQTAWGIANTPHVGLNLLSVILPQVAGNMSFAIIVLMGYIRTLPVELEEAAFLEGCGMFGTYFRVVFPLCKPSMVTVGIFSFLWSYNDLFTQMFFLRTKENFAITVLLNNIASKEGVNYGALFSSVTLIVIPVLVVYLFLNKYIIKGMTVGAVKGVPKGEDMYKVLIVDDEPVICEGLKRSVPWEKYQCEVVGTAGDGLEGLEKMRELKPDILFSDIAMNNMDGLAMVAAIRSEFPDTQVCLLTGYRNFEYAQRAITLGVTRFLLKPSRMQEIEEAVSAMTQRLGPQEHAEEGAGSGLWDMRSRTDRYLFETFLKERPGETPPEEAEASRLRSSEANAYVVKSALEYILGNFSTKLTLTDVADHCFVSSWHLSRLLNQYTGRGFFEIVNVIRVDEAKRLLAGTSGLIADIAEEVGFQDAAHFSRIFKAYAGLSPKEYRGRHKTV